MRNVEVFSRTWWWGRGELELMGSSRGIVDLIGSTDGDVEVVEDMIVE